VLGQIYLLASCQLLPRATAPRRASPSTSPAPLIVFSVFFTMSASSRGRKRDKVVNLLIAPFRGFKATRTPTASPQRTTTLASATSQLSATSAATSSTPSTALPATIESWWLAHRAEIVAGVRQVLGLAKEALGVLPISGASAIVSTTEKFLELVQVHDHPYWPM
jgi:hypothetical protein